jgi:hypothetical protein
VHLGFQVCHSLSGVLRVGNSNVLMFCFAFWICSISFFRFKSVQAQGFLVSVDRFQSCHSHIRTLIQSVGLLLTLICSFDSGRDIENISGICSAHFA